MGKKLGGAWRKRSVRGGIGNENKLLKKNSIIENSDSFADNFFKQLTEQFLSTVFE